MTEAQRKKLNSINVVINHYENVVGDIVIDTTYGSKRFKRMFIGKRGGFATPSIIYKGYDFEDMQPFGKLFKED